MIAVDTNVLVYAVDSNSPEKSATAFALLKQLDPDNTILPWQVVCEFGAALLRKKPNSEINVDIPVVLAGWLDIFKVAYPSRTVIDLAWKLLDAHQLSYWDALLFAACSEAGVTTLYTEDLQSQPHIVGVKLINPFK